MADENNQNNQAAQKTIKLKVDETQEVGTYANAVSVRVTGNEYILDFGYNVPNQQERIIKIVSRVNMSHKTAESFLKLLSNAVLDYKNKEKGGDNSQPIPTE